MVCSATISVFLFLTAIVYLTSVVHPHCLHMLASPRYLHIFSLKLSQGSSPQLCGFPRNVNTGDSLVIFLGFGGPHISLLRPFTAPCISHLSCIILPMQRRPGAGKTLPGCKNGKGKKATLKPFCITNYFTLLCKMFLHNFYQYV